MKMPKITREDFLLNLTLYIGCKTNFVISPGQTLHIADELLTKIDSIIDDGMKEYEYAKLTKMREEYRKAHKQ